MQHHRLGEAQLRNDYFARWNEKKEEKDDALTFVIVGALGNDHAKSFV